MTNGGKDACKEGGVYPIQMKDAFSFSAFQAPEQVAASIFNYNGTTFS
jgi:hypothetical protein